ncbi:ribosome biogenesis GTPase Der [Bacteroidetes bacterium endosymbiont of Geopemphigus sp.]|uniref:ribosome biogenesis GTPase Der n=1 Tax=Bacteroidetes bacterium endosymbiont of Geopemphigus sp. TaxID=2047937 RepID=UPI000CD03A8A|nr:ribosome biogenesis GTPase Der [Bacteroidetes bacterium endosymbiont of Geopemphigus sp.]
MYPVVAIVGRPNVGKSTFFNRLLGRREAIVDAISGVTRDRHYGLSEWNGRLFSIIDTGGYITGSEDQFEREIRKQVSLAIKEADVLLFMVDVRTGLIAMDHQVAQLLRESQKSALLVVNKVDSSKYLPQAVEFYSLGFDRYYCLSSSNGSGSGELLDALVSALPEKEIEKDASDILPKFTIVGRPNSGKSTLINALLGEDRHVVTHIAGTTRDAMQVPYRRFGLECILVDTAGIRKKSRVTEDLEFYSVMRAVRAIEYADVCLLMIDAQRGWQAQDMNIFRLIEKNRKGLVILINKWDTLEKDSATLKTYEKLIREKIAPFNDVPILFISALTKQRVLKGLETAMKVFENRHQKIKTSRLNELMLPIIHASPPPALRGKYIKIKYCTQLPTFTPQFAFFCNTPQYIKEPYKRFIENQLRKIFNFRGVPITIYFRKK